MVERLIVAVNQLVVLLGITCSLSMLLHYANKSLRLEIARIFSIGWYSVVLLPGIACHELGHAIGCWITFTKVVKIVVFKRDHSDGVLGYVEHDSVAGKKFASLRSFIISTGPVWFGATVILALFACASGSWHAVGNIAHLGLHTPKDVVAYLCGLFMTVPDILVLVFGGSWLSLFRIIIFYFILCVSSEMGMSSTDFKGAWRFLVKATIGILLISTIQVVNDAFNLIFEMLVRGMFIVHTMMLMALLTNIMFVLIFRFCKFPSLKANRNTSNKQAGNTEITITINQGNKIRIKEKEPHDW